MDKELFCMLARENQETMYRIAYRIVRNNADAMDAVMEGVLHAYEKRNRIRDTKKFPSWIFQIVKNEAINILRKRKKDKELWEELIHAQTGNDPLRETLNDAVNELPERYKNEIVLYYYCNLSQKEIAKLRKIPIGTVKSRLHRGKAILRERIQLDDE